MTIKTKITLALAFLFGIILLLGGLGAYYLNLLAADSQAILKDNYISLEYVATMQRALADYAETDARDADALAEFDRALRKQEVNVTEVGEGPLTATLRREFALLKAGRADSLMFRRIRQTLFALDDVNRQAIVRKNGVAKETARNALVWLATVGGFCFLIVFSFIINFPEYVSKPLQELTRGIRQITTRNFEERLHFDSNDEFGELARSFNSMAQKLDEYEHSNLARVLFEKKRTETLIQIMSDGIIGLDQNRYVLFVNNVASRLLGLAEGELVGKYAPDVAANNDLMRTLIQEIMAPGPADATFADKPLKIFDTDAEGRSKEHYFIKQIQSVDVTRTGDTQAVRVGYVIVLKNVTSFKELDLAKTNFIATVSHELKTPVSAIKMSLQLLDDDRVGTLNDEQRQLLGHIRTDADRLLNLTGELLNMAQVESGQIQLKPQPVAAQELIGVATSALNVAAAQKNIQFNVALPPNLPALLADPDKASWVLVNFLSNAVRHSPPDARIDISARPLGNVVELRVRDYGPGIRPEHRDRVFDRYFRAAGMGATSSATAPAGTLAGSQPERDRSGGTGLGLAISKEFVTAMQGEVGLDTSVTDGAAFYMRLPVA